MYTQMNMYYIVHMCSEDVEGTFPNCFPVHKHVGQGLLELAMF